MGVVDLLYKAEAAGLRIVRDGDTLLVYGPPEAEPIVEQLREHKPAILNQWWNWQARRLLAGVDDLDLRQDLADVFDERAAICEYDGGLPAPDAEQLAFGELVAEAIRRGVNTTGAEVPR